MSCFGCPHWVPEIVETDRGRVPNVWVCDLDRDPEECREERE